MVNGTQLMYSNNNFVTWESDLDVLEDGNQMFYHCYAMNTFKAKTPNLKRGYRMFSAIYDYNNSSKYATIKLDLDNLENGEQMFYCSRAVLIPNRSIAGGWNLPKLEKGSWMFSQSSVNVAATENSSWEDTSYLCFPALINAEGMFYNCSSLGSFGSNEFSNITNCHEMFRKSNITNFVNEDLLPNGPVVNSEIAYLEESSNYRLAQDSGCNVCMSGMFQECSNLQNAYLGISNKVETRIYAPQMFYLSMSQGGQVHLLPSFEYCVLSADEMFRGCKFSSFTTSEAHNFPQLRSARSMFQHAQYIGSLVINSMPVVEDTTTFAFGCSNLNHVSMNAKTFGSAAFANCINLNSAYLYLGNGTHDFSFLFSGGFGGSGYTMLSSVELHDNGNNVSDIQSCYCMFADCPYLSSASVSNYVSFANVADAAGMFDCCYRANYDTISSFTRSFSENLSKATCMFYNCNTLENMPLTYNQMKNIEYCDYMFYKCVAMNGTFSNFYDTLSSLSSANSMFEGCGNVNGYWRSNLPELLNANGMFAHTGIEQFGNYDQTIEAPKVTNTNGMFMFCQDLEHCYITMANVTTAREMFENCSSLSYVNMLNMPKLTDSYRMFYGCTTLSSLTFDNITNMTSCGEMCAGCDSLRSIDIYNSGGGEYRWQTCYGMFASKDNLTIVVHGDNTNIFKNATGCDHMFAYARNGVEILPENYSTLQIIGVEKQINSMKINDVGGMFDERRIIDSDTAELISCISYYSTLSDSQSMGSIFIEEPSYLDNLDLMGAWSRSEAEEVSGKSYSKIELSKPKGSTVNISLTVYCDTEKYNQYSDPYAALHIVEGSPYIPNASSWYDNNSAFLSANGVAITSVHDGYAWGTKNS